MASEPASTPESGTRIWRFLTYNAVATTGGAIVFALTFEHTLVAVILTFAVLLTGCAFVLREMLTLLGSDEDRLSHASAPAAPTVAVAVSQPPAEPARAVGAPIAH